MPGKLIGRLFGRGGRQADASAALVSEAADLFRDKNLVAAKSKIAAAIDLQPGNVFALQLQGAILASLGQSAAALESFRAALKLDRKSPGLRFDYGNALCLAGDFDGAEVAYRQAIELDPDLAPAHKALAGLLLDMNRPAEAAGVFKRALELAPDDHEVRRWLAKAAFRIRDFPLARDMFATLYDMNLLGVEERYFLGTALLYTGHIDKAGDILEAAAALAPEEGAIAQMLGYKHLFMGNWREGFRLYERRHAVMRASPELQGMKTWIDFIDAILADVPAWTDGGCAGKRLLVWAEQGLGDTIMMLRLLPVLRKEWQAADVTLLCTAPLLSLEACLEGTHFIADWKASPGRFDAHCSIMSLPHLMGITCDAIPGQAPYLKVPDAARARWQAKVATLPGLRVGLAWAGNPILNLDFLRSVALEQLRPLLSCQGVSFVSLQKDVAARDELKASGLPITDWMDQCSDFVETAALMENLDLVISVDTAVAHLAGALGRPLWLLNRFESEWRWMRDREDSVWYPSMRIFNQTETRNWEPIIDRLAGELRVLIAARVS